MRAGRPPAKAAPNGPVVAWLCIGTAHEPRLASQPASAQPDRMDSPDCRRPQPRKSSSRHARPRASAGEAPPRTQGHADDVVVSAGAVIAAAAHALRLPASSSSSRTASLVWPRWTRPTRMLWDSRRATRRPLCGTRPGTASSHRRTSLVPLAYLAQSRPPSGPFVAMSSSFVRPPAHSQRHSARADPYPRFQV